MEVVKDTSLLFLGWILGFFSSRLANDASAHPTVQAGVYAMNNASIDLHQEPNFSLCKLNEFGIDDLEDWHGYVLSFKKER